MSDNIKFLIFSRAASNLMEAMTTGAYDAGKTVMALMIQIIAFLSIYELVDNGVEYIGSLVGWELSLSVSKILPFFQ